MLRDPSALYPFYLFSGVAYLGVLWFLVDIVRVKFGCPGPRRENSGLALNSDITHHDAEAAAAKGDYREAYRLEVASRAIECERSDQDMWGIDVWKSYPHGLRYFGEYFMQFWWRLFGTLTLFSFLYLGLMLANYVGYLMASVTRGVLRVLSFIL